MYFPTTKTQLFLSNIEEFPQSIPNSNAVSIANTLLYRTANLSISGYLSESTLHVLSTRKTKPSTNSFIELNTNTIGLISQNSPTVSCLKSPQNSTKNKSKPKYVRFSSDKNIRYFLKAEPPESCKEDPVIDYTQFTDSEPEDIFEYDSDTNSDLDVTTKTVLFVEENGPVCSYSTSDPRKVYLEKVTFDEKDNIVFGIIKVHNFGFEKNVIIRYTFDLWKTINEINADFVGVASKPTLTWIGQDIFSFALKIPQVVINRKCFSKKTYLEFCVKYHVNQQEHWDNNDGKNYTYRLISSLPKNTKEKELLDTSKKTSSCFIEDDFLYTKSPSIPLFSTRNFLNAPKPLQFAPYAPEIKQQSLEKASGIGYVLKNRENVLSNQKGFIYGDIYPSSVQQPLHPSPYQSPSLKPLESTSIFEFDSDTIFTDLESTSLSKTSPINIPSLVKIHTNELSSASSSPIYSNIQLASQSIAGSPSMARPISPSQQKIDSTTEKTLNKYGYQRYSSSPLAESSPLIY
ncbi:hypothetical protein BB559_000758 [Furculomyces boomerangus]|uniref:CBM21 domain-containing protein n=2 Tax=Harpellales TaxID=61421 RepID=A0A2T9Z4A4_9FUNG|nr:hypothetical protein BB559_000758 [Furculomyces boomerangus]PWA03247.1 hypothetical protein BB558_000577 [Smittium angustum]